MLVFYKKVQYICIRTDQNSMSLNIQINTQSNTLKYIQLVDAIADAINEGSLAEGDMLPSVNDLVKNASLSRDTVFKAYTELKTRGIIESVPNKGYFVTRRFNRVLLFLDTYKAYKEVLYDGFYRNLPKDISVDLMFHHYNFKVFENILTDSIGKYSHYVVMNFDHKGVQKVISKIPNEKLLLIDWNIHAAENHSYVCQDFGETVYNNLSEHIKQIKKYKRFIYLYPEKWTYHPRESISNFEQFCTDNSINYHVEFEPTAVKLQKGDLYFLVSDRTLTNLLDQAEEKKYRAGSDFGIISYNETPMKKYIKEGITVLSTDFTLMGKLAAQYVSNPNDMRYIVPTKMIIRKSF